MQSAVAQRLTHVETPRPPSGSLQSLEKAVALPSGRSCKSRNDCVAAAKRLPNVLEFFGLARRMHSRNQVWNSQDCGEVR
jgi:hypothetical protein